MNVVLNKLWLWFWHLLPANPILVRVVHGASRRPRHLWLRVGYLGVILLAVLFSLVGSVGGQSASLAELAKRASTTFQWASMAQLALMCFLAPVFTASAITQERDAQTFNILLSTPLSNAQIVFGSLMSRLFFVMTLLIAGLPIFLMTMVYGGVTITQVIQSFALSGSTAILTGALAIFVAMLGVGTRRTIFSFYLLIALYLLCVYGAGRWDLTWVEGSSSNIAGRSMSWLTPLHPFLALEVALNQVKAPPYGRLGDHSSLARYALAYPAATYVMWTTSLAFILTLASVFFVRRVTKIGEATLLGKLLDRFGRTNNSGERRRKPRSVWRNPVAWREAKTPASSGRLLRWAIIAGGFAGPLIVFFEQINGGVQAAVAARWLAALIMIQFGLTLIVATNTAATSMTKEKESQTMDLLLTTPLTSKYILWGKLRGLVSFAMPLLAGPVLVLLLFGAHGMLSGGSPVVWIETAVELGILLMIYTAVACVIALWISLNARKNVIAVMYSVMLLMVLYGVASVIFFPLVENLGEEGGVLLASFTPFTSIQFLVNPARLFGTAKEFVQASSAVRIAALVGSAIAIGLYSLIVWRMYTALVRNFDMILRKQSGT